MIDLYSSLSRFDWCMSQYPDATILRGDVNEYLDVICHLLTCTYFPSGQSHGPRRRFLVYLLQFYFNMTWCFGTDLAPAAGQLNLFHALHIVCADIIYWFTCINRIDRPPQANCRKIF